MCGIAGWFGRGPGAERRAEVQAGMLQRIAHRGPDGRGVADLDAASLLHARLSIIDPEGGAQPLWSHARDAVIVFNGEIYNYRELRADLLARGVPLRTQSDTEVVLELLRHDGAGALARLRGMYAFAYWHLGERRGVLARDPAGIKPLFYRADADTVWFASEAKALPATADWRPQLDEAALHLCLNLRYLPGERTLFRGVLQLPAGSVLEWQGGRTAVAAVPRVRGRPTANLQAAVQDSVAAHMVADVPVGCYLSGGIDSAIVAACARTINPELASYTLDAGDSPDEAANAAATARQFGIRNRQGRMLGCGGDALRWVAWHLEVPKVNALQSAAVAQLARGAGSKVCLSGLGGDELFYGYNAHRWLRQAERVLQWTPGIGALAGRALGALLGERALHSEAARIARILQSRGRPWRTYGLLRNVWDDPRLRRTLYGPRMLDSALPDAFGELEARWPHGRPALQAMREFEAREKMVNDLLWNEDRMSMASGLEVRVPFVDRVLDDAAAAHVDASARAPGRKTALRTAFADTLGPAILQRPKSGFQIDVGSAFDAVFGDAVAALLTPAAVREHGLFAPALVATLLRIDRSRRNAWHLFMLLMMAQAHAWLELFEGGAAAPAPPRLVADG